MSGQVVLNDSNPSGLFKQSTHFDSHGTFESGSSGVSAGRLNGNWDSPSRLTFSFAPDGTTISKYSSSLFDSFSKLLSQLDLQRHISDAFQTWATNSSINFGRVSDGGEEFGVAGLSQGDQRFGDIRIGAIPMGPEVIAVATPYELGVSGTWSGDILFNSNAELESVDQFRAVALHEIGHVLGLEHTSGSDDVMNPASFNTTLSVNDIGAIQDRFGWRELDQYDFENNRNDNFDDATQIRLAGSLKGQIPLVVFGDIEAQTDADFFELDVYSKYEGTVTFRVVSDGISQMSPVISVFDNNGREISHLASTSLFGDDLMLSVNTKRYRELFVRVTSNPEFRSVGSYALVTTFDQDVQFDPQVLQTVLRQDYWALEQDDVQSVFIDPVATFNDDLHTNDTLATATDLEPSAGSIDQNRFRVQAGLADSIDVDAYRFQSPELGSTLTATLTAMEQSGLVGKLDVFNQSQESISHRLINNGNGRLVIQVDEIQAGQDYYVAVRADRPGGGYDVGNYTLDMSFQRDSYLLDNLGQGTLMAREPQQIHTLYVAQTQLFNLGIESQSGLQFADAAVWMSVYSETGEVVHRAVTRPGEFRTANSIVLQPGTYSIRTTLALPPSNSRIFRARASLTYQILGKGVSDPMGPELINPSDMPFPKCDPATQEFCYPGDRHSTDPFIVVVGNESILPSNGTTAPEHTDVNLWYWYQSWNDDTTG